MESRSEITQRSVRLKRDLSKMLDQAIQLDRAVKIGWGRDGDEKPKKQETGVMTHLPPKLKLRLLGDMGDLVGSANNGALFEVVGTVGHMACAYHQDGKCTITKQAGDNVGLGMTGGTVILRSDAGAAAGESMSGGLLVIRGKAGNRVGAAMNDGTIVLMSNAGEHIGECMTGGRIVVDGRIGSLGKGAKSRSIETEELVEINDLLSPHSFKLTMDATVIETDPEGGTQILAPQKGSSGRFDGIRLCAHGNSLSASRMVTIDSSVKMPTASTGLDLRSPWIPILTKGPSKGGNGIDSQPCMTNTSPRSIDLVHISEENYSTLREELSEAGGAVIDLGGFPNLSESVIHGLAVVASGFLPARAPVLLMDDVDHTERLLRMTAELGLAGAIVDVRTLGSAPAIAALPTVGIVLSKQKVEMSVLLRIDWTPTAADILTVVAAGMHGILAEPFIGEETPPTTVKKIATTLDADIQSREKEMRGWLQQMGTVSLSELKRHHLRANSYESAAMSGLRLEGYRQPLPMWSRK
ncbi:MAG: hypothetical protein CMB12_01480 [Euryarchaeota archaeon]|nr:hypothetical protein [Euryarchaeota archaeon]